MTSTPSARICRAVARQPGRDGAGVRAVPGGFRHQDGHVALRPGLAAGRAPGRAFAGQRDAFRRDDQDRRLWPDALFPLAGAAGGAGRLSAGALGFGRGGAWDDHAFHRHHAGAQAGADQAAAGLPQHRPGRLHPARFRGLHGAAAGGGAGGGRAGGPGVVRRALPRAQSRRLQGAALPQRRLHAPRHRHAGPEQNGRADEIHAADGRHGAGRLPLHLRRPAVQRLRQQMDHLRGDGAGEPRWPAIWPSAPPSPSSPAR